MVHCCLVQECRLCLETARQTAAQTGGTCARALLYVQPLGRAASFFSPQTALVLQYRYLLWAKRCSMLIGFKT